MSQTDTVPKRLASWQLLRIGAHRNRDGERTLEATVRVFSNGGPENGELITLTAPTRKKIMAKLDALEAAANA